MIKKTLEISCKGLMIHLRYYNKNDIEKKVKWLNDPKINKYLHYDLPINIDRELNWYKNIINDNSRVDFCIDVIDEHGECTTVGLIGLINIDLKNKKGEFYITIGNKKYQGKGIAFLSSIKFIDYIFKRFNLNKIYLYTEKNNKKAQKLFEKIKFIQEGLLRENIIYMGNRIDRYLYGLLVKDFYDEHEKLLNK